MPQAELFDGTVLDFEDGTPDHVIEKVAREQTDRIRTDQARRPLTAGVTPAAPGAGRGGATADELRPRSPGLTAARSASAAVQRQRDTPAPDPNASILDQPYTDPSAGVDPSTGLTRMSEAEYLANYSANARPSTTPAVHDSSRDTIKNTPGPQVAGDVIRQTLGSGVPAAAAEGVLSGLSGLAKVAPGLVAGAADLADTAGLPGAAAVRDFSLGQARTADQFGDAVQGKGGDYYTKLVGNVFNSVTQNLPTMAFGLGGATEIVAGKVVTNLAAKQAANNAMKALFVQTAGQEYGDSRNAGFDPGESAARASIFGAAEVLGERFGFHEQMAVLRAAVGKRQLGSHELGRVLATEMMKEVPGEELTTAIEFLADKYGPAAKSPKATLADYFEQAADTAAQTIGQTLLMGAPASLKGTYQRADAAAAYDSAKLAGLHVNPPYTTDAPDAQRTKTIGMFSAIAAQYGMDPEAVKRATETAKGMPAAVAGPFLARLTDALQKRNLVTKPVEQHAVDILNAGPIDDPKVIEKQAKEAEKEQQQQADAEKTSSVPSELGARETIAEEDLTGLSEPSTPKPSVIDTLATEGATHPSNDRPLPTQAQKEAENYKVGRDTETIPGERLSIENGAGSTRTGISPEGKAWSTDMQDHYGRILGTVGMDSTPEKPQHVDFFAKAGTPAQHEGPVFIVDQVDPKTGAPDEHKVMFGYDSLDQARAAYLAHYEKGWKGLGAITETSLADFKKWVHSDATSKPFAGATQQETQNSAAAPAPRTETAPSASAARAIALVGPMPNSAKPLELRPNKDGSTTAWHDGHEILNFESGEPVQVPKGTSDADALQIVKDSGAFGRRARYFEAPKVEAAPAPAPVEPKTPVSRVKAATPGSAVSDAFLERKRAEQAAANVPAKTDTPASEASAAPAPVHTKEAAKPEVTAPTPPAPPPAPRVRKLSDREAFKQNYAAFEGKTVEQSVQISDTGGTATIRIPAAKAMRALDARLKTLNELRGCIGRHT